LTSSLPNQGHPSLPPLPGMGPDVSDALGRHAGPLQDPALPALEFHLIAGGDVLPVWSWRTRLGEGDRRPPSTGNTTTRNCAVMPQPRHPTRASLVHA
jgi:hypothetical protein